MADDLEILKQQVKAREESLALEQKMLEAMQLSGDAKKDVAEKAKKVKELEGKLLAIKNVCRQEMDKFDEMKKECEDNLVINYDEEFEEGRAEFAEEIFCNYL